MGQVVTMATRADGDQRPEFGAFLADAADCAVLRETVAGFGFDPKSVVTGNIADAVRRFAVQPAPRLLVVELTDDGDPIADLAALADAGGGDIWVLAVGGINDVHHYRRLLAAGVADYLVKPLSRETLVEAIEQTLAAMAEAENAEAAQEQGGGRRTRAIGVMGVRAGAGASMIAASLAHVVAGHGARTALVDLDLHFGTAALQFDLEPGRGLIDALSDPERIDALLLDRAALKVSDHLAVFSAEAPLATPLRPGPDAVLALIEVLETLYPNLIFDLPRELVLAEAGAELLRRLDELVVVAEPTLVHVRDGIRVLARLAELGARAKPGGEGEEKGGPSLRLVLNKVSPGGIAELRPKDFAASVEHPLAAQLPFDQKAAVAAAREARPVVAARPRAPLARALAAAFQDMLADDKARATGGGMLERLFKR